MKVGAQDRPGKGERLGHLKVATPADTGAGAGKHEKQQQEQSHASRGGRAVDPADARPRGEQEGNTSDIHLAQRSSLYRTRIPSLYYCDMWYRRSFLHKRQGHQGYILYESYQSMTAREAFRRPTTRLHFALRNTPLRKPRQDS